MTDKLIKLTDNIYYSLPVEETDRPILAAISGENSTLIVDAGNSAAHAREFLTAVEKTGVPEPKYVAITHWHWDHVFGIAEMNLPTFSHVLTNMKVNEMMKLDWSDKALDERVKEGTEIEFCAEHIKVELKEPRILNLKAPDITFDDFVEIDLGGGASCLLEHVGGEHSKDSVVVYVPNDHIAFIGDCLFADIYHGEWNWCPKLLFPLIDKLLSYDAQYYFESHAEKPITRDELIEYTDRLRELGTAVEKFKDKEVVIEEIKKTGKTPDEDDELYIDWFIEGIKREKSYEDWVYLRKK